uniref:Transcriptional regulator, MerR family n=1 Tax=Hydrogenovibrio crunogenus (strain DSM 25203 / XCL-2) TaxID=317025 RepID=Q31F21_HYDCU
MVQPKSFDSQKQLEIDLPDKKYFTIGEVSEFCQLKSHVLRYWEQVFPQLQPNKRRGRRYYQKRDVQLVFEIKSLLHEQGFTIPGAKARLSKAEGVVEAAETSEAESALKTLRQIRSELKEFQTYINQRY